MDTARFRTTGVVLFVAALGALILSAGATAVNSNKPYSIVICGGGQTGCTSTNPAVVAPGGTMDNASSLTVTFTNDNKSGSGIQIGSDNLNVPSTPGGFSVISVSLPGNAAGACQPPFNNSAPPCFVLLNNGATVGFRNLDLSPDQSMTINMTAATPAPSTTSCTTTSPCSWTDEAKQSNDFSGTGNDLNSDSNSAYGTVTSAVASCSPTKQRCNTTLGNGGTATSAPGSISTTVSSSGGKTTVTQSESIDFGKPLDSGNCSGVSSPHLTFENLSNGADNGSDRSQTITINTTDFPGYVPQACLEASMQFTELVLAPDGTPSRLMPAAQTGPSTYQGLLPDCATSPSQPLQVNCNKTPGVLQRQTTFAADGKTPLAHTLLVAIPPGFDMRISN